ncbi:16S rRNA (adenine(1518)-N(6)/adenine(1519)-N(6))-dimethyltransferase RsmA [Candidatus Xianfuyuplasma coldseepsis]|uniref:Ribosomal RNA small subunit methyltransferase A n=1 Tax=Candidatus Xianfuyuplasma coldseepsis TaxID=2782163 RepID=A0A7L7KQ88_9MOLU|nr:16S rRNA (adenine(1518)-N(6)/adenine(1519)-N(6))-dimethyltransferase RsmA [Xianfuyuplasma coldseepsis]QMS84960.1 16S rRNA (adenine(1518)-N(6)/adenine(1519)-N(6))-dimethyltransferase RsmA [Xianfuyuplasma coldseepsis]
MSKPSSKTKDILQKYNFHVKKHFGQNFLTDTNLLHKIVDTAQVDQQTLVIEIGPGIGSLTEVLLAKAKHVIAYEIDDDLIPILQERITHRNFTLIHQDFLQSDVDHDILALGIAFTKAIVVANLPYYITTPIIMKLIEESTRLQEFYVMMQYEVAKRFTSKPSTKDYNSLSVFIQYKTDASIVINVPKHVFTPAPNVDSAVVRMRIKDHIERFPIDEKHFFKLVRNAFSMRRKTLANNLSKTMGYNKQTLQDHFTDLGFSPSVRAEALQVDDFITLSDILHKE